MQNRCGNQYDFQPVGPNTYTIVGDLNYWRYGGREGQQQMDFNDLGFVDPSGGPFIGLGYKICGRTVVRIRADNNDQIFFDVE